ncbi:alpha-S2-casein-like [Chlorocebus sabaeus]|uniref:alpha-S2-casein-like n=1 Tax=Chlorocebus sabaeus TaxID=60711 RepID=UPI003BF9F66B
MFLQDQTTMKFFIFTCLLAVALAQHESAEVSTENNELTKEEKIDLKQMESTSISQEESAEVFPEKIKSNEEKNYLKQLMKINQFLQKFTVPQYVQAVPLVVYEPVESHSGKHLPLYSHLGMTREIIPL